MCPCVPIKIQEPHRVNLRDAGELEGVHAFKSKKDLIYEVALKIRSG